MQNNILHVKPNAIQFIQLHFHSFQEQEMITHDIIIDPIVNKLGAWTLPIVNLLASKLTTFKYSDIKFQMG